MVAKERPDLSSLSGQDVTLSQVREQGLSEKGHTGPNPKPAKREIRAPRRIIPL